MGALYEDVEKFFGDIFAFYGKFLSRYPVVFILLSLLTSCLLGMGLLNLRYETHVDKLYTPMGSPAFKDQAHLADLFPDRTSKAFYAHQQLFLDTYGGILVTPKVSKSEVVDDGNEATPRSTGANVITMEIFQEIQKLYEQIKEITLEHDDRGFKYKDLCAFRQGACVVDGAIVLGRVQQDPCLQPNQAISDASGHSEDVRNVLSAISTHNNCVTAEAFRLRFNLRHDTAHQRNLGLLWEMKFLEKLKTFQSDRIDLFYSVSESLDIELTDHVGEDTKFFALTIIIMVLYATFVSSGGNWVNTRVLLAQAGVMAALLAILASFGLLSMCGMVFVDICGVMPFLVLGVGVDDMFILMSGWRQTDVKKTLEERVSETFRSSAISVTITSLTDLLAFCIGATSPFLSVKNFCIYTGVAVFLCYINQLTFFGGCLVLHARRVEASRHCFTCQKTKSRRELVEDGHARLYVLCCSGHPPKKAREDDSLCEKIPSSFMPRMLLKGPTKLIVILGFIVYLGVSIWGASQIKTGLKLESVVPESSYLSEFIAREQMYFSNRGAYIMFVLDKSLPYATDSDDIQKELHKVFHKAQISGYLDDTFRISWLDDYLDYRKNMSYTPYAFDKFNTILREEFLVNYPQYENDILFSSDGNEIVASRFYLKSMRFQDSAKEGDLMLLIREIAKNSTLDLIAYSPEFIYYEHYVSILKNTLLAVGVAIIGMLFVALMFIPHPISITCVTLTMVTIVLGMFGFMHFWGLALSAITTVQIILSVGFCVDFTVHISHAFMTATGKNRNERVMSALEKVGVPILNGAVSSILGILMLAFASSYIFKSFFKTMMLVIMLGVAHSLLLLPVMLSFVGPRRTSKPRVFIPISAPNNRPPGDAAAYKAKIDHQGVLREQRMLAANERNHNIRENIELLQLNVPNVDKDMGGLLQVTDIDLIDKDSDHASASSRLGDDNRPSSRSRDPKDWDRASASSRLSDRDDTRPSSRSRDHKVVIERAPDEEVRLSQFVPRADRTPSPLLCKPQVEKEKDIRSKLAKIAKRGKKDRQSSVDREQPEPDKDGKRKKSEGKEKGKGKES